MSDDLHKNADGQQSYTDEELASARDLYHRFILSSKYGIIAIVVLLVLMALFLL